MAMSADLGDALERFVKKLVASGRYHSKSEVLREGVRLIRSARRAWRRWTPPSPADLQMRTQVA